MTDHERDQDAATRGASTQPSGPPPDEGKAYDPEMTDEDEANIPPESDADPEQAVDKPL